uniref:Ubiquinol-cytochrome c reductase complex assembly factor 4 n=1 Tax=Labrus bergylta TaxID=56723 RepID=A0A3Q3MKI7_9LABR
SDRMVGGSPAATRPIRLNSVRSLTLSSRRAARPINDEKEVKDEPIKFSTSKASHRTWKVDQSMGSKFQRPWWKVLPISLCASAFLLWCALREETDIDEKLERKLYEQLPGLLSDKKRRKIIQVDKSGTYCIYFSLYLL